MAKNRLIDLQKSNTARQLRELWSQDRERRKPEPLFLQTEYKEVYDYALQAISELSSVSRPFTGSTYLKIILLMRSVKSYPSPNRLSLNSFNLATRFVREQMRKYQQFDLPLAIGLSFILLQFIF